MGFFYFYDLVLATLSPKTQVVACEKRVHHFIIALNSNFKVFRLISSGLMYNREREWPDFKFHFSTETEEDEVCPSSMDNNNLNNEENFRCSCCSYKLDMIRGLWM